MFYSSPNLGGSSKPSLKPLLYSAAIFPGIGQWMQKRPVAAFVYGGAGTIASLIFIAVLWQSMSDAIRIIHGAWTWGINPEDVRAVFTPLLKSSAFLLVVYLANVYDTWYAWYRAYTLWRSLNSPGPLEQQPDQAGSAARRG